MMNTNGDTITCSSAKTTRKRKFQPVISFLKKLRSNIPRRKRNQISPIIGQSSSYSSSISSNYSYYKKSELSGFPVVTSSSSSCLLIPPHPEISYSPSNNLISIGSDNFISKSPNSESKIHESFNPFQAIGDSSSVLLEEKTDQINKNEENRACYSEEASFSSQVVLASRRNHDYVESNLKSTAAAAAAEENQDEELAANDQLETDSALVCSEHFSNEQAAGSDVDDDDTTIYHRMPSSALNSDEQLEFSDHTFPLSNISDNVLEGFSDYFESDDQSEASDFSAGNSSPPTAYFSFLLQYTKQFSKLSSSSSRISLRLPVPDDHRNNIVFSRSGVQEDDYFNEFTFLRFEDEDDEESYKQLRSRERTEVVLTDYMNEYYTTTDYGHLVLQQRLLMVNWIIQESNVRELNLETTFLGVSLLDRFLSQGYFKNKRKLQLLGIACLTLATRIEENQPLNCVRQKTIHVGSNAYSRCEVVAMEWLLQEVLHFQCFLPTTYNFLWFYLETAKANEEMEKTAKYLAVLSLLDHQRLRYWPSSVAAGLVILSALAAKQDSSCLWVIETHIRNKTDDLAECLQSLEWLKKEVSC